MQLLVVDPNKRVIMVNKDFLETKGYTEEEILGRQLSVRFALADSEAVCLSGGHHTLRPQPITVLDRLKSTDEPQWFERHLAPDF